MSVLGTPLEQEMDRSYGTPAFHVRKKLLVRLREDGETLAIKVDFPDRDVLLQVDPDAFYLTDHYVAYPWMLVRLSRVRPEQIKELLEQAWRRAAPKRIVDGGADRSGSRWRRREHDEADLHDKFRAWRRESYEVGAGR